MDFNEAVVKVKQLKYRPTDDELLELYGFYKQAVVGDNITSKPWIDFKARAKWEAWRRRKGMSSEAAKKQYIKLVEKLIQKCD
uniref:ACB domain-containing protein n=1 Tax=Wuchereria bancrofti TaxID=6293 RepID=A0AAF5PQ78_WUCBA